MTSKVIVITGASGGIGAAAANILAGRGDKVVLGARRKAELNQVAAQCGTGALPVVTDVTRRADVENLRNEALRAFGRVDVWIRSTYRRHSDVSPLPAIARSTAHPRQPSTA
jgi:NADP-dependent 3-hydroxy acid dehydrogenase YdfG